MDCGGGVGLGTGSGLILDLDLDLGGDERSLANDDESWLPRLAGRAATASAASSTGTGAAGDVDGRVPQPRPPAAPVVLGRGETPGAVEGEEGRR